jgi:hypothetical protein
MVRFLVILDSSGSEDGSSVSGVISKFALGSCFEVRVIATQLIVSINLIQGILIAEELILGEAHVISLRVEFIGLLSCKVLTPTS